MGLFSNFFGGLKSDSINIVTNLLKHQVEYGFMDDDPKTVATQLVNNVWNNAPDVFEGKFGQSPFKLTVAIYALVKGYDLYPKGATKDAILTSIGNAFSEIQMNGAKYPLNSLDQELLQEADTISINIMKKVSSDPLFKEVSERKNDSERKEIVNALNEHLQELSTKNEEQIAVRLTASLMIKEDLITSHNVNEALLNGDDNFSDERKALIQQLWSLFNEFRSQGRTMFGNGTLLWIMTLQSYDYKETTKIASTIWEELHKKAHLVKGIFDALEEDGLTITQPMRNSSSYTPSKLK